MADTPPRRWYQFRLSTIFLVIALLAWTMSRGESLVFPADSSSSNWCSSVSFNLIAEDTTGSGRLTSLPRLRASLLLNPGRPYDEYVFMVTATARQLIMPAVFISLYLGWRLASRIKRNSAESA